MFKSFTGIIKCKNVRYCFITRRADRTVLGIETSCDDTGCAVVNSNCAVSEALHTQGLIHLRNGGINPIIARELHKNHIESIVEQALHKAAITIEDVDAIAVTVKPGILLSLQVGAKYGRYLSRKYNKPFIPIHHMEAHALVVRLCHKIDFPYLVLLISGGHCLLGVVKDVDEFILLGETIDDKPGETLDKIARRLKLRNITEYSRVSGGQAIEMAAAKAIDFHMYQFPLPMARYRDCNFSFSGLKDAVTAKLLEKEKEHGIMGDKVIPEINELCASFQLAITEHLMHRTRRAMLFSEMQNLIPDDRKTLVISGGVASNDFIFKSFQVLGKEMGYGVYRPPPKLCTDNGTMIAWNGMEKLKKGYIYNAEFDIESVNPVASLGINYIAEVQKANIPVRPVRLKNKL